MLKCDEGDDWMRRDISFTMSSNFKIHQFTMYVTLYTTNYDVFYIARVH